MSERGSKPGARRWWSPLGGVVLIVTSLSVVAYAADDEGTALMRRAEKAHRIPYEHLVSRMVLQEKGGAPRPRTIETWVAQDDANGDKLRTRFSEPAEVNGLGLLTLETTSDEGDEQWLFLPAFRKTRRIGQSDLGDRFAESDLVYEDLKRRRVDEYSYVVLPSEKVDGVECHVVESKPKAKRVVDSSPYGRTLIYLRKDNLAATRVRYFDRKDRPLKGLEATKFVKVGKTAWRATDTVITDLQRNHRTTTTVVSREVKEQAPGDEFTKQRLQAD